MPADPLELGPFVLLEPIARGGMGEVWRGSHGVTGLPVAVKVVREELARVEAHVATFRNEVRAMASLDHPCILTVLDYGEIDARLARASRGLMVQGSPYLVMEYAGGGSLKDLKRRLGWADIRRVLLSLLDALAHAHARGVIHRDLKAGNVLVATRTDVRPGLKLADFGIAHAFADFESRDDRAEQAAGTLHYMAREQLAGAWRDYGPWTDLYALACLAWRLITGSPPFHGIAREDIVDAQLRGPEGHIPEGFPAGFETWLRRMLAAEPRHRFTRAADAAWALLEIGEPPGPPSPTDEIQVAAPFPFDPHELAEQDTTLGPLVHGLELPDDLGGPSMGSRIPPIPMDWRRARAAPLPMTLHGAGLGLFPLRTIPLVGREQERDKLWSLLIEVHQSQRPRFAVITGPPGAGKTALASWLAARAHELGAATPMVAQHREEGHALSELLGQHLRVTGLYGPPLKQQLRRSLRGASRELRKTALDLLQELPRGPAERFASTEALLHLLVERSGGAGRVGPGRPLLLVLDDVDGGESVAFVRWLMDRQHLDPLPALVLVVATALEPPHRGQLFTLVSGGATALHLDPLAPTERAELMAGLLRLDPALAARVDESSAGNPQLAVGLVADLVYRRALEPTAEGFGLRRGEVPLLPDALHDLWSVRIDDVTDGLGPEAQEDLERAAILGLEVDEALWHAVCDDPRAASRGRTSMPILGLRRRTSLTERLLRERLALETDDGFVFASRAVQESLVRRAVAGGRASAHHAAVVAALRTLDRVDPARIGRHLKGAGQSDEAFEALLVAAQAQLDRTEYRPALGMLSDARAILEEAGLDESDSRWGRLWVGLADGSLGIGRVDEAYRYARRAVDGARAGGWPTLVDALFVAAQAAVANRRTDDAAALLDAMEPLAGRAGPRVLGRCLFARGNLLKGPTPEVGRSLLLRARALFAQADDRLGIANVDRVLGIDALAAGHLARAEELLTAAAAAYQELGMRSTLATTWVALADVFRKSGRLGDAEALLQRLVELNRTVDLGISSVLVQLNLGLVRLAREDWVGARRAFDAAAGLGELTRNEALTGASWASLLAPLAALEDWPAFDTALERARHLLQRTNFRADDLTATLTEVLRLLPPDSDRREAVAALSRRRP